MPITSVSPIASGAHADRRRRLSRARSSGCGMRTPTRGSSSASGDPCEWPATFTRHDMAVGGESHYYMTGPDGTKAARLVPLPRRRAVRAFEVEDGFADEHGAPNAEMPTMRMIVLASRRPPSGSRFTSVTQFPSIESMEQLVQMGMMEGMKSAMGQIDARARRPATLRRRSRHRRAAAERHAGARQPRHPRHRASRSGAHITNRRSCSAGCSAPTAGRCPSARWPTPVGERYRYEWESADGQQRFGFEGELLESAAPYRAVTTERMIGTDGPVHAQRAHASRPCRAARCSAS